MYVTNKRVRRLEGSAYGRPIAGGVSDVLLQLNRFLELRGKKADDVAITTACPECDGELIATFRDLSEQKDYGGFDFEGGCMSGALHHLEEDDFDCGHRLYVQSMCTKQLESCEIGSGNFQNHLIDFFPKKVQKELPMGTCLGDYRNSVCMVCGILFRKGLQGYIFLGYINVFSPFIYSQMYIHIIL